MDAKFTWSPALGVRVAQAGPCGTDLIYGAPQKNADFFGRLVTAEGIERG